MAAVTPEQQATYTPGPWSVCYDHPYPERRDSIAYIRAPHTEDFDLDAQIAVVYGCRGNEERKANARVLAAAPDLLNVAQWARDAMRQAFDEVLQTIPEGGAVPSWMATLETTIADAEHVIAKATGVQS